MLVATYSQAHMHAGMGFFSRKVIFSLLFQVHQSISSGTMNSKVCLTQLQWCFFHFYEHSQDLISHVKRAEEFGSLSR